MNDIVGYRNRLEQYGREVETFYGKDTPEKRARDAQKCKNCKPGCSAERADHALGLCVCGCAKFEEKTA